MIIIITYPCFKYRKTEPQPAKIALQLSHSSYLNITQAYVVLILMTKYSFISLVQNKPWLRTKLLVKWQVEFQTSKTNISSRG